MLSQTYSCNNISKNEKKASYYISKKIYQIYGAKLAELRIKNNIIKKDLAKSLNISFKTLNDIELGLNNNPYYYYNIYCNHFSLNSNSVLDFSLIETTTLIGKIEFLKANLGIKSLKELDIHLNMYPGAISEYLNKKSRNNKIEEKILNEFNKISSFK